VSFDGHHGIRHRTLLDGTGLALTLLTRRFESQQREGVIIANLVNPWNSFGKSVCIKTA